MTAYRNLSDIPVFLVGTLVTFFFYKFVNKNKLNLGLY